jgi:PHD/YefM family antitoxin component YafN of YafNO toxin-antitoxin module
VKNTYNVTEAQAGLPRLLKWKEGDLITITRHNRPVGALIAWDRLAAIMETLELLGNPEAMRAIRADRAGKGKFHPLTAIDTPDNEG